MVCQNTPPRSIAVIAHPTMPEAIEEAGLVAAFLAREGIRVAHGLLYDDALRRRISAGEFELVIAIGGDGTILRAGHLCAPVRVPLMGINMGRFGFLHEVQRGEWNEYLPMLLQARYRIESRMLLSARLLRSGEEIGCWEALNDVFAGRAMQVRPVQITLEVDGYVLTAYNADGLIASTPTGSTAYALAVGGPILPPDLRNILIMPVAPHLSLDRAIVLAEGAEVGFLINTTHQAVLSVDGQAPIPLLDNDQIKIAASANTLCFVRFHDPSFFYKNLTSHMDQNPITGLKR